MVRLDKSDPAPVGAFWDRLIAECSLRPVLIPVSGRAGERHLSETQAEALFKSNITQLSRLSTGAGSLVKGLIMELERCGTFIRLSGAQRGGHEVKYELLSGSRALVKRIATALGFERVTDTKLLVSHV